MYCRLDDLVANKYNLIIKNNKNKKNRKREREREREKPTTKVRCTHNNRGKMNLGLPPRIADLVVPATVLSHILLSQICFLICFVWPFVLFYFVLFCFVLFCFVLFRFGLVWFGLVWFGLVRFGLVRFGLVWFGLVWFGLVWFVYPLGY